VPDSPRRSVWTSISATWRDQLAGAPASAWAAALHLGLAPAALGFVLWGHAMANLPVATSTALLYLVPPVAVLIAFVWLGEMPRAGELLGGLVVLAGVVRVSRARSPSAGGTGR
jgi:drug/metabolite transporter (DMT)-like permease